MAEKPLTKCCGKGYNDTETSVRSGLDHHKDGYWGPLAHVLEEVIQREGIVTRTFFLLLILGALTTLAGLVIAVGCGGDDDNDNDNDEYDCDELVDDPTTDCDSVCTKEICTDLQECGDYVDVGSVGHCIDNCLKGCQAGCIPVGADDCLKSYSDCESLIACLKPLFNI